MAEGGQPRIGPDGGRAVGPRADVSGPEWCDLLLAGGLVLTLDEHDTIIPDGAIAVRDRRIVAVASRAEVERLWTAERVLSCPDHILMPGLINVHNHTPLMITRGMIEDLGFAPMFTGSVPQGHHLSMEDTQALSQLGVYELLRNGCTTVVDFYRHPRALAEAHAMLGTRAIIAGRVHDADLEALTQKRYEYLPAIGYRALDETAALIETWDGYDCGRLRCDWAPHAPDTCSADLLRELATLAAAHGGNIHTHLCQSELEVSTVVERCGRTPPQVLAEAGLLDDRLVAAHCIHVTSDDIALMGRSRMTMAYAPIGNAKTARIAPAMALAEAGVRIALCTDTFSGDLIEAMRWGVAMQRIRGAGTSVDARAALHWATQAGAQALRLSDQIGSLAVGKKADVIALKRTEPSLAPIINCYGIIVYSASGSAVDTVVVDGRVVIEAGELKTGDGPAIVAEAQAVAERLWAGLGRTLATTSKPTASSPEFAS
ncbi:MAG: amidohydrolase family protein [Beijerinckiaceae bacterium]